MEISPSVVLVVAGFPSIERPSNGIFSLRFAQALALRAELSVVHLRAWLPSRSARRDVETDGFKLRTIAIPQLPGFTAFSIAFCRAAGWPMVRDLLAKSDLIHSVGIDFAGLVASSWARRARKHHVAQVIGSDIARVIPRLRNSAIVQGWERNTHAVVCNSQRLAQDFLKKYPRVPNVRTIYRGVDLARFTISGPLEGPLVDKQPVRYAFLGGFPKTRQDDANVKGGETLLAAWKATEQALVKCGASLLLAGPSSRWDQICRWRASLRHPGQVHLAGDLRPESVPAHIRSADVVLVPSLREGVPNVALEASACGRPVFGSEIPGIIELIVPGKTGVLLPPGDVKAWADALVAFASRVQFLGEMGKAARAHVEKAFDAARYVPEILNLYRDALAEPLCERVMLAR